MEHQSDFRELLALLNAHRVEYAIVGGYALAWHGAPRFTGDLDILIEPVPVNARRILAALTEFGFAGLDLTVDDFTAPDRVVQLGYTPVRVDILSALTGVSWDEVAAGRVEGEYGGLPVPFIGRAEFIQNKKALGRHRDLADIEALGADT